MKCTADRVRQQTNHQHAWQVTAELSMHVEIFEEGMAYPNGCEHLHVDTTGRLAQEVGARTRPAFMPF